jgi:hypothetical protein
MKAFFKDFPPNARVWIYQADRPFPSGVAEELQPLFDAFAKQWTSHKDQLKAEIRLLHNSFIVIMLDEDYRQPSGCGIDASVSFVKDIGKKYGIDLFNRMRVSFIIDGKINNCPVNEFVNRLHTKEFNSETVVINTLVQSKEELFTQFTIPARESWLKKYL